MIKNICVSLVSGYLLYWIGTYLESTFICDFLNGNLITLLVALLAINATTMSILLTQLSEIKEKNLEANFDKTIKEMKLSIKEQVALIVIAIVLQILLGSVSIQKECPDLMVWVKIILIAVFCFAIMILYDTARSIFVVLENV